MFPPGDHTESEGLVGFIETQLDAIRAAAFGLTDAQARQTPCRSALSIGGLVKHATYVLEQRAVHAADPEHVLDRDDFVRFVSSFSLAEEETLEEVVAAFDRSRATYLADIAAVDPGASMTEPPAPWDGRPEPTPSVQRFALLHHVEELARHAGHADIIREQIDGASAAELLMALEGRPGNDFVQPWRPAT